jgi:hypothetical protein
MPAVGTENLGSDWRVSFPWTGDLAIKPADKFFVHDQGHFFYRDIGTQTRQDRASFCIVFIGIVTEIDPDRIRLK